MHSNRAVSGGELKQQGGPRAGAAVVPRSVPQMPVEQERISIIELGLHKLPIRICLARPLQHGLRGHFFPAIATFGQHLLDRFSEKVGARENSRPAFRRVFSSPIQAEA